VLAPLAAAPCLAGARVICTAPQASRALPAEALAARWQAVAEAAATSAVTSRGRPASEARAALALPSVRAALEEALGPAMEPGPVIVAGSLYLVGEARAILVDDPRLVPDPPLPALPPLTSPEAQP